MHPFSLTKVEQQQVNGGIIEGGCMTVVFAEHGAQN